MASFVAPKRVAHDMLGELDPVVVVCLDVGHASHVVREHRGGKLVLSLHSVDSHHTAQLLRELLDSSHVLAVLVRDGGSSAARAAPKRSAIQRTPLLLARSDTGGSDDRDAMVQAGWLPVPVDMWSKGFEVSQGQTAATVLRMLASMLALHELQMDQVRVHVGGQGVQLKSVRAHRHGRRRQAHLSIACQVHVCQMYTSMLPCRAHQAAGRDAARHLRPASDGVDRAGMIRALTLTAARLADNQVVP